MEYVHSALSKIISKRQNREIEEMERSLKLWIDDHHRKSIPVDLSIIQAKALSLHGDLKNRLGEGVADVPVFHASKSWFDRFKARACLNNIKLTGEA